MSAPPRCIRTPRSRTWRGGYLLTRSCLDLDSAFTPLLYISAPVYFNIGDAGNREGHSDTYLDLPAWSAFRNGTQYGHSRMDILNATHARWRWFMNKVHAEPRTGTVLTQHTAQKHTAVLLTLLVVRV